MLSASIIPARLQLPDGAETTLATLRIMAGKATNVKGSKSGSPNPIHSQPDFDNNKSDHETHLTSDSVAASKLHHSDTLTRAWFWVPLFDPGAPLCLLPLDRRVVVRGGYPPKLILAAIDDEAAEADAAAAEEVLAHSPSASPPI